MPAKGFWALRQMMNGFGMHLRSQRNEELRIILQKERMTRSAIRIRSISFLKDHMGSGRVSGANLWAEEESGLSGSMILIWILPENCLHAASIALSNLLGLVCDPIAGLVEAPCRCRNGLGVVNAFTCAQLALSGIIHLVPFDEMAEAMCRVGRALPYELRETAFGGNAGTPTGCRLGCEICGK